MQLESDNFYDTVSKCTVTLKYKYLTYHKNRPLDLIYGTEFLFVQKKKKLYFPLWRLLVGLVEYYKVAESHLYFQRL